MATTTVNGIKLEYEIETDGTTGKECAVIIGTKGKVKGSLEIPAEIKGYPVIYILEEAFYGCESLTSVTIPDSVTSIWKKAFYQCSGLTSVTIPDSVTSIGVRAFEGCGSILDTKTIPSVKLVDGWAVGCDKSFSGDLKLTGVRGIGNGAFYKCSGLTSVTIPDSVTSVGAGAFSGCSALTSVTIPDSVTSVGAGAFSDCSSLKNIAIPDSVTSIRKKQFYGCESLTSVTIPDSVTSIGDSAFSGCSALTSVTIPHSVTSIGDEAFAYCAELTSVEIGNGVTEIGKGAFMECGSLVSVTIPGSVTHVGGGAFDGCSVSLFDTKTIPGVELVDGWVVGHDTSLSGDLNLTGIRGMGGAAFYYCRGLKSMILPKHLEGRLPEDVFAFCSEDLKITYCDEPAPAKKQITAKSAPAGKVTFEELALRVIDYINSNGNYSATYKDGEISIKIGSDRLYWFDAYCFLAAEEVPDGNGGDRPTLNVLRLLRRWDHKWDRVGRAQRNFVKKCEKLLRVEGTTPEELALALDAMGIVPAENVESRLAAVKQEAPEKIDWKFVVDEGEVTITGTKTKVTGAVELPSVLKGLPVTSIGAGAFKDCYGLTGVTISGSVTRIGNKAFERCVRLTSVTIPVSVTGIGEEAFYGCKSLTSVTIPDSVTRIGDYAFRACNGLTSVTMPANMTRIGLGVFQGCESLTNVTIPDSVASIEDNAFEGCCESLFDTKTIPGVELVDGWAVGYETSLSGDLNLTGIRGIGDGAFCRCGNLKSVSIPSTVSGIGEEAFKECYDLARVKIATGVTGIGSYAFNSCGMLKGVTIPSTVTSIGSYAFDGCSDSLFDTKTIPGVKLVDGWAVGYETSLSGDLNLTGIRGIGGSAFWGCKSLTSVTMSCNLKSIGGGAFINCSGLTSVTIPDSVTSIGEHAFQACSALTSVTIPGSVTSIGSWAFRYCRCLTNVSLPNHLEGKLPDSVFEDCSNNLKITYRDESAPAKKPAAPKKPAEKKPTTKKPAAKKPAAKKAVKKTAKKK